MSLTTEQILQQLISFDTTSRNPNRELISYVTDLLDQHNINSTVIENTDGSKANLYATIGPPDTAGVMLSGHTDVVPIDGQQWQYPAFSLSKENDRYYGRGTADMKGFVACALSAAIKASSNTLQTPLHLALSYDEEIGCVGVHSLLDMLQKAPVKPAMCIVGEPTQLQVATKHKGKTALLASCIGTEGHSALAPNYLNAIHLACDFVAIVRELQNEIANDHEAKDANDIPYSTVHVGRIMTGQALNIVPNLCTVHFEIRHPLSDSPEDIFSTLKQRTEALVAETQKRFTAANITFETTNAYPALDTPVDAEVVRFVQSLLDTDETGFVAFGTEAGLFSQKTGVPSVVCGPGSMEQGHKPDEYVSISQMRDCERMLERLIAHLITH